MMHTYISRLVERTAISDAGYWNHCGSSNFLGNPGVSVKCADCIWHASVGFYDNTQGAVLFKQDEARTWANITATTGKVTQVFYYRAYILPDGATANPI